MPRVRSVLETCLYVDDLDRARSFYTSLFEFKILVSDGRLCAMAVAESSVLILFQRGGSLGRDTPHDSTGPAHFAFAIDRADLEPWHERLAQFGIAIESEVKWPLGGVSLYFRDPDGHLGELATPGVWDFSVLG